MVNRIIMTVSALPHRTIAPVLPGLFLIVCLLAGCQEVPATYGSHQRLSEAPDRVVIIGNHSGAVSAALTWLQSRGLSAVGAPFLWEIPTEDFITKQAQELHAQTIVWVQQSGDLRAPMVSVRGTDVDSREVLWSGHARATEYRSTPAADRIAFLTCHALNAAWGPPATGDRRPGFPQDRCE